MMLALGCSVIDEKRAEPVAPGLGGLCQQSRDWRQVNRVDGESEMFGSVKMRSS